MTAPAPVIAFLSDYGLDDPFVGLCHLAVAAAAPTVRVVDLVHTVPAQDVRRGATLLVDCLPWLPAGAVVLAVVDPGVGTQRRGVIVTAGEGGRRRLFVGPDNGLLAPATHALGGATAAWELPRPPAVSTFDGRDVFAPAAGRLARGDAPEDVGRRLDPTSLIPLALPGARVADGLLAGEVVHVDGFGNLALSVPARRLGDAGLAAPAAVRLEVGDADHPATLCRTFADVPAGELAVLPDAFGRLQIAVNRGSAAARLGVDAAGVAVTVRAAPDGGGAGPSAPT